jgi:MFS family permease
LVAIPLGRTADKFGRKKVLASSLLGSVTGLLWILVVCLFATLAIVDFCFTVRKADIADILYRQFLFGLPDSFGLAIRNLLSLRRWPLHRKRHGLFYGC